MRDEYNMPRTRTVYLDSDKIESLTQDGFQYFLRTISERGTWVLFNVLIIS